MNSELSNHTIPLLEWQKPKLSSRTLGELPPTALFHLETQNSTADFQNYLTPSYLLYWSTLQYIKTLIASYESINVLASPPPPLFPFFKAACPHKNCTLLQWLRALKSSYRQYYYFLFLTWHHLTGDLQRCTELGSWVIHITASNYSQRSYATLNTDKIQWPLTEQAQNMPKRIDWKHWQNPKMYLFKLAWATHYVPQQ